MMKKMSLLVAGGIGYVLGSLYRADAVTRNADVVAAMGMMPNVIGRWSEQNAGGLLLQADAAERGFLDHGDRYTRLRQPPRGSRSSRSTADHDDVIGGVHTSRSWLLHSSSPVIRGVWIATSTA